MIQAKVDAAEALLIAHGAGEIEHPGGTLLAHLRRVGEQLAIWGAAEPVQLAGFCHACYGTDDLDISLIGLDSRRLLGDAIGTDAEALVYLYGSCDRRPVYRQLHQAEVEFTDRFTGLRSTPPVAVTRAFVEITAANELDIVRYNSDLAARYGPALKALFARAEQHLSTPASQAWNQETIPSASGSDKQTVPRNRFACPVPGSNDRPG